MDGGDYDDDDDGSEEEDDKDDKQDDKQDDEEQEKKDNKAYDKLVDDEAGKKASSGTEREKSIEGFATDFFERKNVIKVIRDALRLKMFLEVTFVEQ